MDNDYDEKVAANVKAAIEDTDRSVHGTAKESGIAYTTLDRKLKGLAPFNVSELRRLSKVTGRPVVSFFPVEVAA
ncbi:hypothetical protein [Subtercola sp. RTI3]|uniref:hypothetical protein n=1 Tax=Subtercola sp. RTI3 TaxID=3048639 RepID=UPI002B22C21C|nr:hypothetical protein [Subtercola sp. RTI3]MEA9983695.1 hypothetical protein [Subtercola sp. RTI3]